VTQLTYINLAEHVSNMNILRKP